MGKRSVIGAVRRTASSKKSFLQFAELRL